MDVEILPHARAELINAVEYYEREHSGLGVRFWNEVDRSIEWIANHAAVPRLRPSGYRRVNLRVFPFYVAYVIRERVRVVAIAHVRREPEFWLEAP